MRSLPLSYIGSYGGSREKMPLRQFYRFHRHFLPYSTSRFPAKTNREANEVTGAVMSAVLTI